MGPNLYLVLSKPPDDVSPEEYDGWYDLHVREIVVSPGFLGARRFALEPSSDEPVPYSRLAVYEYEGELGRWSADLTRRIESGEVVLPEFHPRTRFSGWSARPLGDRVEPARSA